jgi:GT2 family glycosyltransferase
VVTLAESCSLDVCCVLYRCDDERVRPGLRPHDHLWTRDNTNDNVGFAAGANELAARGGEDLICFVNPDGDLTTDCLDVLERAFHDESVVAAEPDLGAAWNRERLPDGSPMYVSGACMVVRRDAFEAVGGFDERLFMYGEDVDLSWKLGRLGRLVHVDDAHFRHDSGAGLRFASLHRNFRNWLVVSKRHRSASVEQMLRDSSYSFRKRQWRMGLARLTGVADYLIRARRWA